MLKNRVKEILSAGKVAFGGWLSINSPEVAEIAACAGLDWLLIDVETGLIDLDALGNMMRAITGPGNEGKVIPLAGVESDSPEVIMRTLDAGAYGVVVPMINSMEQAAVAARATRYPPLGNRRVAIGRATRWDMGLEEYLRNANNEILFIPKVEHVNGVKDIERIVELPGVDGVMIGTYDLSASMGLIGQVSHPSVLSQQERIVKACQHAGKWAGTVAVTGEEIHTAIECGFRLIGLSIDSLIFSQGIRNLLDTAKKSLEGRNKLCLTNPKA